MQDMIMTPVGSDKVFATSFPAKYDDKAWLRSVASFCQPFLFSKNEVGVLKRNDQSDRSYRSSRARVDAIRQAYLGSPKLLPRVIIPDDWWQMQYTSSSRPSGKNGDIKGHTACREAKVASFWDLDLRSKLGKDAFLTLRAVEPGLLPWSPEHSIHDANKLADDHLLSGCIPNIKHRDFCNVSKEFADRTQVSEALAVWCPTHKRAESWYMPSTLLWALSCGLLTFEEFKMVVTLSDDSPGHLESSHLCGNNFCIGLNCVVWELVSVKDQRKHCHAAARAVRNGARTFAAGATGLVLSTQAAPCSCVKSGRTTVPCKTDACSRSPASIRQAFIDKLMNVENLLAYLLCPVAACGELLVPQKTFDSILLGETAWISRGKVRSAEYHQLYAVLREKMVDHLCKAHAYNATGRFELSIMDGKKRRPVGILGRDHVHEKQVKVEVE